MLSALAPVNKINVSFPKAPWNTWRQLLTISNQNFKKRFSWFHYSLVIVYLVLNKIFRDILRSLMFILFYVDAIPRGAWGMLPAVSVDVVLGSKLGLLNAKQSTWALWVSPTLILVFKNCSNGCYLYIYLLCWYFEIIEGKRNKEWGDKYFISKKEDVEKDALYLWTSSFLPLPGPQSSTEKQSILGRSTAPTL